MIGFNHLGRMGRLGNQMFQYAALKGIARNRNFEFCIPYHPNYVDDGIGNLLRSELFDCFDFKVDNVSMVETSYVNEPHFRFSEDLFNNCPDNVSLVGFFQTDKYFRNIENEIRKDFTFKKEIYESCSQTFNELELKDPIALHIRRGDYTINSDRHPTLPMEYYSKALSQFPDDSSVVVFSDDSDRCGEQEIFSSDRVLISTNADTYHDLCLMSLCSNFIIANSTFSWWGAVLANTGKVCYPSLWFGPSLNNDLKDLFLDNWTRVDV